MRQTVEIECCGGEDTVLLIDSMQEESRVRFDVSFPFFSNGYFLSYGPTKEAAIRAAAKNLRDIANDLDAWLSANVSPKE